MEDGEADAVLALEFAVAVWHRLMRDRHDGSAARTDFGLRDRERSKICLAIRTPNATAEGSNPAPSSGEPGATSLTGRILDHLSCRALGVETLVRRRSGDASRSFNTLPRLWIPPVGADPYLGRHGHPRAKRPRSADPEESKSGQPADY
jgi:hypothetical protein